MEYKEPNQRKEVTMPKKRYPSKGISMKAG